MSQQFLRQCSLVVASDSDALELSDLRVQFRVKQFDIQTPNNAIIKVSNLSETTAQRVKDEFTRVVLKVGYFDGGLGVIFDGSIKYLRRGRDSATDTYFELLGADGDQGYNFAVVNTTLTGGATNKQQLDALAKSFAEHGVTMGYAPDLPDTSLPRGKVMYGMARDYMRDLARSTGTTWSIYNGQLQMVANNGYVPGEAVVLSPQTGLIGIPEQTIQGINVKCLINSNIKIGGRIQIDRSLINEAQRQPGLTGDLQAAQLPRLADDGFYRVVVIDHSGDTRGNEWYSSIICVALDDTVPLALGPRGYV